MRSEEERTRPARRGREDGLGLLYLLDDRRKGKNRMGGVKSEG